MKYTIPISSISPRGLKNLFFSFYNKAELLSKATNGNFYVSKDFCYSIGDETFKERLLDKIIVQQEEEQDAQGETALLGIKIENRTDDYEGDLVFTGFNQSEGQEEAAQEDEGQEKAVQEDAAQEDAVQVADKPNFDPELENTPTVGTETAANVDVNDNVNVAANNNAVEVATSETPLLTLRDRAISAFLDYLVNHCNEVKHVYLEDEDTKNEKFAMRAWFTQLGWRGKEDNELRSYFYDRLEGNTAFRTEEDHARWAARWQPRYFDKHPEMKWVLEEQKEPEEPAEEQEATAPLSEQSESESSEPESDQHMAKEAEEYEYVAASNLSNLIVPDETADATEVAEEVAEAVSATVGTEEDVQEAQEIQAAQAAQESVEHTEAVKTDTESVSESMSESVSEPSAEATQEPNTDSESDAESDCESSDTESSDGESENKNNSQETADGANGAISDGVISDGANAANGANGAI